jgi:hypothetical protein
MRKYLVWSFMLSSLVIVLRAWAWFDEGQRAYEQGDYATALREWRLLAEQGHAEAQRNLGSSTVFPGNSELPFI